jgi:hypothetical protein
MKEGTLIKNAKQLVVICSKGERVKKGKDMNEVRKTQK